jgi:adenylate cyclase
MRPDAAHHRVMSELTVDRLSQDDLVRRSACSAAQLDRYVALGLIRPAADGMFATADVSRVRLLDALGNSGITADQLAAAERAGGMTVDFAGEVVADQPGMTLQPWRTAIAELGLDTIFVDRVFLALGLPAPALDDLVREDDSELLDIVVRVRAAGVPDEALLRILRVFAVNLTNIVASTRDLFRQELEEPLMARGMSDRALIARTSPLRLDLQRLSYRATFLIERRLLERTVFENLSAHFERNLHTLGIATGDRDATRTIAFLDMSGFTRMTEEFGDRRAADHGARLLAIVQDSGVQYGARLVKLLGDGAMLHFRNAGNAVRCTLQIVEAADMADLPPVRAGIATGPVIARDGDYYGHTVNLAARLVAAAAPGAVLVTDTVRDAAADAGFAFAPAGEIAFKGIDAPVATYVADLAGC